MIQVDEVNDIYQLAGYRLLWNSLLPQTPDATFFQSLDWLEAYWKHFGSDQKLRVLVVSRDHRPVGILPLVVRPEATRVGTVRVLTYPLDDWGTFYGPIGPNPTATLTAGLRHVRETPQDWDMLDLRWTDLDGCDRGRTKTAMRQVGFRPCKQGWDRTAMVDMAGTWEDYWSSRTKKWRHNVRRCGRRLAERGEVTHLRYRPKGAACGDGDPRWDLFDACVEIAERSWQGSSDDGTTMSHGSIAEFLRDVHEAAAASGALDLNLLLVDGKPVAFTYNYHYQGRVYALRKGFDPEYTQARPGLVLEGMVLEDSFRRGDSCYDMGVGSLDMKRHWQTEVAASYRFTHFPAAVSRVQVLRMKRWFQDRVYGQDYAACAHTA